MTFGIIHSYLISAGHLLGRGRHGSVAPDEGIRRCGYRAYADAATEKDDLARRLHQSVA
jgi:hypothetical protein